MFYIHFLAAHGITDRFGTLVNVLTYHNLFFDMSRFINNRLLVRLFNFDGFFRPVDALWRNSVVQGPPKDIRMLLLKRNIF